MISNDDKKKFIPLLEKQLYVLSQESLNDVYLEGLENVSENLETTIKDKYIEIFIDASRDKIKNYCEEAFDSEFETCEEQTTIKNKFNECFLHKFKSSVRELISTILYESRADILSIINRIISKYTNIDAVSYEEVVKLSLKLLEYLELVLESNNNSDYRNLLAESQHETIVKKFFDDNYLTFKKAFISPISELEDFKDSIKTIQKEVENAIFLKIQIYLKNSTAPSIDLNKIAAQVLLDIKNEFIDSKIDEIKNMIDELSEINHPCPKGRGNQSEVGGDINPASCGEDDPLRLNSLEPNNNSHNYALTQKHIAVNDGDKGITYEVLFGNYLKGANQITLIEPYLKAYYQFENLVQFCHLIVKTGGIKKLHIITKTEEPSQRFSLKTKLPVLQNFLKENNIELSCNYSKTIHDREINCDNGWTIKIGRGLHIYKSTFGNEIAKYDPSYRECLETKIDFFRKDSKSFEYDKTSQTYQNRRLSSVK